MMVERPIHEGQPEVDFLHPSHECGFQFIGIEVGRSCEVFLFLLSETLVSRPRKGLGESDPVHGHRAVGAEVQRTVPQAE